MILPALLQSLHYLRGLESDELEDFKREHPWARRILARLDALGFSIHSGTDSILCLRAAQALLHSPIRRSLENIEALFSYK